MKVAVPYIGELQGTDARLMRLIEFLGIPCETICLPVGTGHAEGLNKATGGRASCLVVNPRVIQAWLGQGRIPGGMISCLLSSFRHVLVHGVRPDPFDSAMVAALSGNRLESVRMIDGAVAGYAFAPDSKDVCSAFSGLAFGPANPANDHVFALGAGRPGVRPLISIGRNPFLASVTEKSAEVLFVASEDVAEPATEVGDAPLAEYFSRFVPHAMALRYAAGTECWRPGAAYASLIIDDPLLQHRYGFLNFETLLRLARQHEFHATVAFIPHNFRRSSSRIARMFRENGTRLSICFHGNDHTAAEFASHDPDLLTGLVRVAERRMASHQEITGISCDRVMVFPQGDFSREAMRVLQSHNFLAAVNTTPHPADEAVRLTIEDLAQPAVLRYGGFPLFLRRPSRRIERQDVAFDVFFGRPILTVEHHEDFRRPETFVELVETIRSVAPEVQWRNLAAIVGNSVLRRTTADGAHHIRAYSGAIRVSNGIGSRAHFSVAWNAPRSGAPIEQAIVDGTPSSRLETQNGESRVSLELPAGASATVALLYRSETGAGRLGFRWNTTAFLRRRLSEVRDNYLSKNDHLLKSAKAIQRHVCP